MRSLFFWNWIFTPLRLTQLSFISCLSNFHARLLCGRFLRTSFHSYMGEFSNVDAKQHSRNLCEMDEQQQFDVVTLSILNGDLKRLSGDYNDSYVVVQGKLVSTVSIAEHWNRAELHSIVLIHSAGAHAHSTSLVHCDLFHLFKVRFWYQRGANVVRHFWRFNI